MATGYGSLPAVLTHLRATSYLSGAGLVTLLYDHILTFDDEVQYIWKARWTLPKFLFLLVRYVVPIVMLIQNSQMNDLFHPTLTDTFCKGWFAVVIYIGMLSMAASDFLILLRLWVNWDRNRRLMLWTLIAFGITHSSAMACATFTVVSLIPAVAFQKDLHMCMLLYRVNAFSIWIPGAVFEIMIFVTTCWNAFERPMHANAAMTKALYRDGFIYFIVMLFLRIANVILAIAAPLSLVLLGIFFIWCSTTVTVSRLILNLRKISANESHQNSLRMSVLTSNSLQYRPTRMRDSSDFLSME